ncbi:Tat pathway signal sequence domain protein [Mycolicibacterium fortuitum subsp. acetamidolyticum]|uniref:Tat pathway signal sequence domain protein n=1 Tax=Mycolicibacterium fortuitum subsp. acetamidolyticum TaxID=144550 RepID=A0A100WSJ4_MYCFO|nr:hypothetical protein [Mycolicibacterium fortuitum]MCV7139773.1 hypothetical protein [Mycolicibacterium fortuitum]GAT03510.1 Tat pathway signal sequence domain protein [Mycolicibacterium fortuitum subsp. acetamidolyticum]
MHPRFPGALQSNPDFVTAPGSAVPQCTRCGELVWDTERHNRSRHPVAGVWRYHATTSDNTEVLVRYHDGRWQGWLPSPVGRWNDDAAIPAWPGTFTPCGGYASGGVLPPGPPPFPDPYCGYTMSPSVVRELGRGIVARINASAAVQHQSVERRDEGHQAALVVAVQAAMFDELDRQHEAGEIDGAGYWNREEWGAIDGEPRWTKIAEAAVAAVTSHMRGTTTEIVTRLGGRTIEITNRDEDH